ncbi:VOC family protein [Devosia sp.]|uniref:VOC family protein n=1 Tax=Devosia sp. TaxID=1871048 RepID=UPI001AC2CF7F|nr:VOC family protein [Devosia sp.]MBN9333200.1 VOC family protein [Devosia sp.]
MLSVGSIVWGVEDVPRAIEFWCAALDYEPREAPGVDWAVLVPRQGTGVQIALDLADTPAASGRPRHHLDLYADNQAQEVERLLALGAKRVERDYPPDADFVVLADPDGNRFCVIQT